MNHLLRNCNNFYSKRNFFNTLYPHFKYSKSTVKKNSEKFSIKGPLQLGSFANSLDITSDELKKILIKVGVDESEISTIVNTDTIVQVLKHLKKPYNILTLSEKRRKLVFGGETPHIFKSRPPIVTIMGHIDHGKTTLLDALRRSDIAGGETGGITQKIGAFTVKSSAGSQICFIDTPGHFAFNSSRSRGVQATDLILLIISIDDGIQEQTLECLKLAKASLCPIIVVVTKIDKVKHDSIKIQSDLVSRGVKTKLMGGNVECVEVSARTGENLDLLLDTIGEFSKHMYLEQNSSPYPIGFILECKQTISHGHVSTAVLKSGTISLRDVIETDNAIASVKVIFDEYGGRLNSVTPGIPVQIAGWKSRPNAGDLFQKSMKNKISKRDLKKFKTVLENVNSSFRIANYDVDRLMLDDNTKAFNAKPEEGYSEKVPLVYNLIVHADSQGSLDAILQALGSCSDRRVKMNVLGCGLGKLLVEERITAMSTGCKCFYFDANEGAKEGITQFNEIPIHNFNIIYHMTSFIKEEIENVLGEQMVNEEIGEAKIKRVFNFSGNKSTIAAGCEVNNGMVLHDSSSYCEIYRNNVFVEKVSIESLKSFKKDVKSISEGNECGIVFQSFTDFQKNDIVKIFSKRFLKIPLDWRI